MIFFLSLRFFVVVFSPPNSSKIIFEERFLKNFLDKKHYNMILSCVKERIRPNKKGVFENQSARFKLSRKKLFLKTCRFA